MDILEQATFQYLESLDLGVVCYEPGGTGTAPDFQIGPSIAVEATRLVKVLTRNGIRLNVTQTHPGTIQFLKNIFEQWNDGSFDKSFFVNICMTEPIDRPAVRMAMRRFLDSFSASFKAVCPPNCTITPSGFSC